MRTYQQYTTELNKIKEPAARLQFAKAYALEQEAHEKLQAQIDLHSSVGLRPHERPQVASRMLKRGGKRPGAGRPPLPLEVKCRHLSIRGDVRDVAAWDVLKKEYGRSNRELFTHCINLLTDYLNHYKMAGHPEQGLLLKLTKNIFP